MAETPLTPETSEPVVWLNGQLSAASEAYISPFDHGLLTGDGVFETLCVYGGKPFAETRHYQRLLHSAAALGLAVPTQDVLSKAMAAVVEANGFKDARIRITLTGGVGPLGSDKAATPDLALVAASSLPNHAATASIVTVPYVRNERGALVGIKSTSYGENVAALAYARKHGGNEAIFANSAGNLCEGTGSNIFLVLDGNLITPTLASGCLAGITRAIVLDLCQRDGIPVEEVDVAIADLK
ncbi:MAG: aminotransferase class IV, partial [Verrucomicrobia bacterium]|nr:aminotransferase class IV [Verrucomicrobiota bacterium]